MAREYGVMANPGNGKPERAWFADRKSRDAAYKERGR